MSEKGSEDTVTTLLEQEIKKLGGKTIAFSVLRTPSGIRKPDLLCEDGGKYPVEAKFTERDYLQAIAKIENDYLKHYKTLGIKGGFAVLYPTELSEPMPSAALSALAAKSNYKLVAMFPPEDPRPFKVYEDNLAAIAKIIVTHVLTPSQIIEPSVDYIIKSLRESASYIVNGLKHLAGAELETFFGGKNVFKNILEYEQGGYPEEDLRSAAAYLLINQLLFYQVISRFRTSFKEIDIDSLSKPSDLNKYFEKVLDINYRVIFSYDVASLVPDEYLDQVRTIVSVVKGLAAEKVGGDLLGTIFHDLIPFEVRKTVAAFYTNVLAAELLAFLAIDKTEAKVSDFALGSGGLLVASYRRKKYLAGANFNERTHQDFLQHDLLGVDVMPFAANIAACHLALQAPQYFSDKVQIAIWDSTDLRPEKAIPSVAHLDTVLTGQTSMLSFTTDDKKDSKGVVSLTDSKADEIKLEKCDVAIMNPPFTRQERLPERYKTILLDRFEKYKTFIHGQLGFYGYFVFLADEFLNENGKMALILPASVLRLQSCEGIRKLWSERYVVDYIISSEYRSAFSESVSFREILILARRAGKEERSITKIATLKRLPRTLTESRNIARGLREANDGYEDSNMSVRAIDYAELKHNVNNWFKFIAVKNLKLTDFFQKLTSSGFVTLSMITELIRGYELMGGQVNSLIINSKETRAFKSGDIWILSKSLATKLFFHYRGMESRQLSVPLKATRRTLRRPSGVNKIDITKELDYVIVEAWDRSEFNKLREATSHKLSSGFMEKFKKDVEARMGNFFIVRRMNLAAPNTYTLAFVSNVECSPTKLVWSAKVPKNKAKLLAAFFNSSINLLQTLLSRAETEGSFIDLSQYILEDFQVPDFEKLSQKHSSKILAAFGKMSKRPLPSLIEQLRQKDPYRFALDKAWLEALHYKGDPDKLLNWLYNSLTDEIETLKSITGTSAEEEPSD